MFQRFLGIVITLAHLGLGSAFAQTISPCNDWRGSVLGIAEPWEPNTRIYAGGAVRLVILNVGEPVAGSSRLTPPTNGNPDARLCQILSPDADMGFAGLSFDGVTDSTDPIGLTVFTPARGWISDTDTLIDAILLVTAITDSAIAASLEQG